MSKLELLSMAKGFKLHVEGCSVWWMDVTSGEKDLNQVRNDLDALTMAFSVGTSKEIYVCVRLVSDGNACVGEINVCNDEGLGMVQSSRIELLEYVQEEEDEAIEDVDLEEILIMDHNKGKTMHEESDSR